MEAAIGALVRMSHYAGMRLDLVQAGGGNTSVKLGNRLLIKASGYWLSEVTNTTGWSILNLPAVQALLDDPTLTALTDKKEREEATSARTQALVEQGPRSSIETLLHATVPYTYVLHSHPLAVNIVACQPNWKETFRSLYPDCGLVPYDTPGLELTLALRSEMHSHTRAPQIFFLQNHGLLVGADSEAEVLALHEQVVQRLEQHLGIDHSAYRHCNTLATLCNRVTGRQDVAMLYQDAEVQRILRARPELRQAPPFCPDMYVFCGAAVLELLRPDKGEIEDFVAKYHHPPKVVAYAGQLYALGANLRKCYELADVLKFHLLVLEQAQQPQYLPQAELDYLGGWEAEKYRQQR